VSGRTKIIVVCKQADAKTASDIQVESRAEQNRTEQREVPCARTNKKDASSKREDTGCGNQEEVEALQSEPKAHHEKVHEVGHRHEPILALGVCAQVDEEEEEGGRRRKRRRWLL